MSNPVAQHDGQSSRKSRGPRSTRMLPEPRQPLHQCGGVVVMSRVQHRQQELLLVFVHHATQHEELGDRGFLHALHAFLNLRILRSADDLIEDFSQAFG